MSPKEAMRVYVMQELINGSITTGQAAESLGLSTRQIRRLRKGMESTGVGALAHGNEAVSQNMLCPLNNAAA